MTTEATIYKIPDVNYDLLQADIKRLQNRAKKLGSEDILITEIGHEDHIGYWPLSSQKVQYLKPGADPDRIFGFGRWTKSDLVRRYYLVTISGTAPKLNGWSFIGAIDLIRDDQGKVVGNMLRCLPDTSMPEDFRTAEPRCDHCGKARRWKSTYAVVDEQGNYKQIGRTCLKDFTGHANPDRIAAMAEILMSASKFCEDYEDEDFGGGGRGRQRFSVAMLLERVATIVRIDGWKSRRSVEVTGGMCTADELRSWLYAQGTKLTELEKHYVKVDGDKQVAAATLEWLHSLTEKPSLDDYEHNLSLMGMAGSIEDKAFGILASAVPAYLRNQDREARAQAERQASQSSEYIGKEKERLDMVLILASLRYSENAFGTTTMCKYQDENGNVVIWWASKSISMALGTKVKVRATVKKHAEYNGIKQTVVSRLDVLETLEVPQTPASPEAN